MKTTLCFTLTLLIIVTLAFVPNTFAQDTVPEYVLRVVYFVPKDRVPDPNMDTKLDTMVKDIQKFYADEMERHGFDRKTFNFETDENGNVKVHHVKGIHNDADYISNNRFGIEEIEDQFNLVPVEFKNIYLIVFDYSNERVEHYGGGSACGIGSGFSIGGFVKIPASGPCFNFEVIAHELGHTFGLKHDFRSRAFMMSYGRYRNQLSQCAAEWLDVHRYFNSNQEVFNRDATREPSVQMLTSNFVSPPTNIRLRFEVTDPDGLHQAQLQALIGGGFSVIACQRLSGQRAIAEFVTDDLLGVDVIEINIIDVHGNYRARRFTIDITDLLPPELTEVISIPDPNLALEIRRTLGLSPDENIRKVDMLGVDSIIIGVQITDLTGLQHAIWIQKLVLAGKQIKDIKLLEKLTDLVELSILGTSVSDLTPLKGLVNLQFLHLRGNPISDIRPLTGLTELTSLDLFANQISDISPLTALTQLNTLYLHLNQISDISALAALTQLNTLYLQDNEISDIRCTRSTDTIEHLMAEWQSD